MKRYGGWYWYTTEKMNLLEKHKCGKWMCFHYDQKFAMLVCEKAISEDVCYACKCTDMETAKSSTYAICFYTNCDDLEGHKKILEFMISHRLIPRTKTGKLYNISFKLDDQTRANEYGENFKAQLTLDMLVELTTGEWYEFD